MNFRVITEPTIEPVEVDDFKEHLRVTGSTEDSTLAAYLLASRGYIEARMGRTIQETTLEAYPECFGGGRLLLPRAYPLQSVVGVWYRDSSGTETQWGSGSYVVDLYGRPGSIQPAFGGAYPAFTPYPASPIRIRYIAGGANSPYVEPAETIKQAIRLLAAAMYENREAEGLTDRAQLDTLAVNYGVEAFISMNQVEYRF